MNKQSSQSPGEKVFESDDFIAFNKPAGVSFHKDDTTSGFFNDICRFTGLALFPVHRLDKITSGVTLFAKNKSAAGQIGEQFANREVNKSYIALSDKKPKKKQGLIKGEMVKTRNGSWKLTTQNENPAITRFVSRSLTPGIRFFWITPATGKTHQIRVALKSLGAPILGDLRYSGSPADRGYLHAYSLQFSWQDQTIKIHSLPEQENTLALKSYNR